MELISAARQAFQWQFKIQNAYLVVPEKGIGVVDAREHSLHECKLGVQSEGEEHEEEQNRPQLGQGEKTDGLWIGHKGQALLLPDHFLDKK